jgi:energy-coupling factor transporter transmembrane protein EcfT
MFFFGFFQSFRCLTADAAAMLTRWANGLASKTRHHHHMMKTTAALAAAAAAAAADAEEERGSRLRRR